MLHKHINIQIICSVFMKKKEEEKGMQVNLMAVNLKGIKRSDKSVEHVWLGTYWIFRVLVQSPSIWQTEFPAYFSLLGIWLIIGSRQLWKRWKSVEIFLASLKEGEVSMNWQSIICSSWAAFLGSSFPDLSPMFLFQYYCCLWCLHSTSIT